MKFKNTLFSSCFAFVFMVISCTKDDSSTASNSGNLAITTNSLMGKWIFDKTSTTVQSNTGPETSYDSQKCTENKSYYIFKANDALEEGYVSVQDCSFNTYQDSWTLTDNKLKITLDTGTVLNYTVESITATKLTIKSYPSPGNEDVYSIITFKKG